MNRQSSATALATQPLPAAARSAPGAAEARSSSRAGLGWGLAGVAAFALTLPLTRVAVHDLPPDLVAFGRAVVAGLCAAALLAATRQRRPERRLVGRIVVVALGVVVGFPWLSSLALQSVPASHAAVVIGLLPAATAVASVLRTGERPSARFWAASVAGALAVVAFVSLSGGGLGSWHPADLLLVGAVLAAAVGYAEGGLVSRIIGSWQTICWALVISLPVMTAVAVAALATSPVDVAAAPAAAWWCFAYLALVSMFLGFFAWYRGLAIGPMAQVSQVQLVQPVMSIGWAAVLLGERLDLVVVLGAVAVIGCAALAVRSR